MPRKITRDHAEKTQRPMVEDRVIAEQLTALLTPAITSGSRFFRELGQARENTDTSFDGSCGFDFMVAGCTRGN